jgi:DNA invertase Pin-like site-specific DNA recombinase
MSHTPVNGHTVGQRIGYTRVSTVSQTVDQQNDALGACVTKTFSDTMSGARDDRPGLAALLTMFARVAPSWCGNSTA